MEATRLDPAICLNRCPAKGVYCDSSGGQPRCEPVVVSFFTPEEERAAVCVHPRLKSPSREGHIRPIAVTVLP